MKKLKAFRKSRRLTKQEMARLLNISPMTFGRYERGSLPQRDVMQRIIELTRGTVTPNDWFEIPDGDDDAEARITELPLSKTGT